MSFERILVTGGAGFIGSHLVDQLLANDFEVTVLDNLSTGKKENIQQHQDNKKFNFIKGDIRDKKKIEKAVQNVDAIFHDAAVVSVSQSINNPILTNDVNVAGTINLLQASSAAGVKRFIYSSSCSVYGETDILPVKETHVTNPVSPYAVSKLAAEKYCKSFYNVSGLETIILRYFNVYGPRQIYGSYSGVITIFMSCLQKNEPPVIYGDGTQTRDFVHVKDIVQASISALKCKNATGEEFNVGTGNPTTINEIAQMLLKIMNKTHLQPKHVESRLGDIKYSYADITKAKKILNYVPKMTVENGLRDLVDQFSE